MKKFFAVVEKWKSIERPPSAGAIIGVLEDVPREDGDVEVSLDAEVPVDGDDIGAFDHAGAPGNDVLPSGSGGPDWKKINAANRKMAADWLQGAFYFHIVLIRLCMEPFMVVFRKMLYWGSIAWEKDQRKRAVDGASASVGGVSAREYRVVLAARGELDAQFHLYLRKIASVETLWRLLGTHKCTEKDRALAFRILAKGGAEYCRVVTDPHKKPKFRVFLLITNPEIVQALKELPDCVLGAWVATFLSEWGATATTARMILVMIAIVAYTDTMTIENWHAWLRRVVTRMSVQAHRPHIKDVAGRCFLHTTSSINTAEAAWNPKFAERTLPSTAAAECQATLPCTVADNQAPKKKRRTGGGGAWRLHVGKHWSSGERDSAVISAKYRERNAAQVEADLAEGAAGTARHRRGEVTFAPTRRDVTRRRIHNLAIAMRRQHALANDDNTFVDDHQSAISPLLADVSKSGYQLACKIVRRCDRLSIQESKALHQKEELAIQEFGKTLGRTIVDSATREYPALIPLTKDYFHGLPLVLPLAAQAIHCQWVPDTFISSRDVLSCATASRKQFSGLLGALDRTWACKNLPVSDEGFVGGSIIGSKDVDKDHKLCYEAGICMMTAKGRQLYRFRNAVLRFLKLFGPAGTLARKDQVDGRSSLLLRGKPREKESDDLGWDDLCSCDEQEVTDKYILWHLSNLHLSPYIPCFQEWRCELLDAFGRVSPTEELPVEATWNYLIDWNAYSSLDLDNYDWHASIYLLSETEREIPLADFIPSYQHLLPHLPLSEIEIWNKHIDRPRSARKPPSSRSGGPTAAERTSRNGRGRGGGRRGRGRGRTISSGDSAVGVDADDVSLCHHAILAEPRENSEEIEEPHDEGLCAMSDEEPDEAEEKVAEPEHPPDEILIPAPLADIIDLVEAGGFSEGVAGKDPGKGSSHCPYDDEWWKLGNASVSSDSDCPGGGGAKAKPKLSKKHIPAPSGPTIDGGEESDDGSYKLFGPSESEGSARSDHSACSNADSLRSSAPSLILAPPHISSSESEEGPKLTLGGSSSLPTSVAIDDAAGAEHHEAESKCDSKHHAFGALGTLCTRRQNFMVCRWHCESFV